MPLKNFLHVCVSGICLYEASEAVRIFEQAKQINVLVDLVPFGVHSKRTCEQTTRKRRPRDGTDSEMLWKNVTTMPDSKKSVRKKNSPSK